MRIVLSTLAIIMEAMRKSWTDERLDDLNQKVSEGFNRVDAELRAIHTRIDALQRTMIVTQTTFIAALVGLIATQL